MGIVLCLAAFFLVLLAGWRSLSAGLIAVLGAGYFYGILRANFPDPASHFIFDAAVVALYLTQLFRPGCPETTQAARPVLLWIFLLILFPLVMMFVPTQDWLVRFVGLRGNVFLLPFLFLGARLTPGGRSQLAFGIALLNLVAFGFTAAEYTAGLEHFFPRNPNSALIYTSADVAQGAYRIPSIFTGSHAYAGTMVMTLPLLISAWASGGSRGKRLVLILAIASAILGTFAAASRVHSIVLLLVLLATAFSGRMARGARAALVGIFAALGLIVATQERLQRFTTLSDTEFVARRFTGSVNTSFADLLLQYPFGNGLGGGGTSLPYFLQNRVRDPIAMENEYARILLEQGVAGLCIWVAFIAWFVSRRFTSARGWEIGEHLAWVTCVLYFGTALIGIGLLTSIPQTALLLLCAGWVAARKPTAARYDSVHEAPYAEAHA